MRWRASVAAEHVRLKNSFWYAWHHYNSGVEVIYEALSAIPQWRRTFDVVIAGAIVEHLSDPVSFIGDLAMIADEAIIVAFTPVDDSDELKMTATNDWSNPKFDYTFWQLSRGLYNRIFDNLGFDVEMPQASARAGGALHLRNTIIARRRQKLSEVAFAIGSNV